MHEAQGLSRETKDAESADAVRPHAPDRAPTPEEEEAAERGRGETGADEEAVAEHYEEMTSIGTEVKGEGEIT